MHRRTLFSEFEITLIMALGVPAAQGRGERDRGLGTIRSASRKLDLQATYWLNATHSLRACDL